LNLSERNDLRIDFTDDRVTGEYKSLFDGIEFDFNSEKYFKMSAWGYTVLYK
jgi:hypothetical protein